MLNKALMPCPELAMEIKEAGRSSCSSKHLHWVPLADAAKPCQHPAPRVSVLLLELTEREKRETLQSPCIRRAHGATSVGALR